MICKLETNKHLETNKILKNHNQPADYELLPISVVPNPSLNFATFVYGHYKNLI